MNYFSWHNPIVYAAPDVYASALLTGKAPSVQRVWKVVGDGMQSGLAPIMLGGTIPFDPRTEDLFRVLIQERVRVLESDEHPEEERKRIAQLLKIVVNSAGYGIFAELIRQQAPPGIMTQVTVFGNGASYEHATNAPEKVGKFCFPPIAAVISAAARMMLALLERCVTDLGGSYAFCDTDSMAIVATERGDVVPCHGGALRLPGGDSAVRALTWSQVRGVQSRFDALNPYDQHVIPTILNIEKINFTADGVQRPLNAYVLSAKRYALYSFAPDGSIQLDKCSRHGIGNLMNPLPKGAQDKWAEVLWALILSEALGIPHDRPSWLDLPAVMKVPIGTPAIFRGFLKRFNDIPYTERIKPFGFLLACQVSRFGRAGPTSKKFHLFAPFSKDPESWATKVWTDSYSGEDFGVTTARSHQPRIIGVRSIATIKAEFLAHGEVKSATADGKSAGADARGLLQRRHVTPSEIQLIGKESNYVDLVETGLIGEWSEILTTYEEQKGRPSPEALIMQPAKAIARAYGVSVRTVRAWRRGGRLKARSVAT